MFIHIRIQANLYIYIYIYITIIIFVIIIIIIIIIIIVIIIFIVIIIIISIIIIIYRIYCTCIFAGTGPVDVPSRSDWLGSYHSNCHNGKGNQLLRSTGLGETTAQTVMSTTFADLFYYLRSPKSK